LHQSQFSSVLSHFSSLLGDRMDRGFLLGVLMVFIGWAVILISMALTKSILAIFSERNLLIALVNVSLSLLAFSLCLLLWYLATRSLYRRILRSRSHHKDLHTPQ